MQGESRCAVRSSSSSPASAWSLALVSAYVAAQQPAAQPPVFNPAANPYAKGIYAEGIIESAQAQGENINIYPEVSGPIIEVLVAEGAPVHKGEPLLRIDDSVQRATAEQLQAQAQAAHALLLELKAEPRPETLDVGDGPGRERPGDAEECRRISWPSRSAPTSIDPRSVSMDALDNARNAEKIAATNLEVVEKQYRLTKAGAWIYDIKTRKSICRAVEGLRRGRGAARQIHAQGAGRRRRAVDSGAVGSYVSPQGAYDSYTQGMDPLIVMGAPRRAAAGARLYRRDPGRTGWPIRAKLRGADVHPRHRQARRR